MPYESCVLDEMRCEKRMRKGRKQKEKSDGDNGDGGSPTVTDGVRPGTRVDISTGFQNRY
jgi:hypothetical protein